LRRGISELIGGAFEWLFCPEGREFEQANLQKLKCPGGGGGVGSFKLTGTLPSPSHGHILRDLRFLVS